MGLNIESSPISTPKKMFRPYKILFFFSCILAIFPSLKCLVLLSIIDANGFVSTVDPTSNNELSGNQTTPQIDGSVGEENNDNKQLQT
jgi:hypothetical protein